MQLTEKISNWKSDSLTVNEQTRTVHGVALVSTQSGNGYEYSQDALRDAVPLYDGKPVFLDHSHPHQSKNRSTRDLVGTITNPRLEKGRIRADIDVLDTEAGRTFLALAQSNISGVGMSHVVIARKNASATLVTHIEDVISVDVVVYPASTKTLRERMENSTTQPIDGTLEHLLEELRSAFQDHTHTLFPHAQLEFAILGIFGNLLLVQAGESQYFAIYWQFAPNTNELVFDPEPIELSQQLLDSDSWREQLPAQPMTWQRVLLSEEPENTQEQLLSLKRQHHSLVSRLRTHLDVERLLRESSLPTSAITQKFRQQLRAASNNDVRQQLIAERLELINSIRITPPTSQLRQQRTVHDTTDHALLQAIKTHKPKHFTPTS